MSEENILPIGGANDFAAVVQESKEKIFGSEPVEKKRRRGRRPGRYGSYKKLSSARPIATSETAAETSEIKPPVAHPGGPDISKILIAPLKLLSSIPANRLQVPELALTDEEAKPLSEAINGVINAYAPDLENMSPKAAALLSLGLVTSSIFIAKYEIYSQKTMRIVESNVTPISQPGETPVAQPEPTPAPTVQATGFNPFAITDPDEYFKRGARVAQF